MNQVNFIFDGCGLLHQFIISNNGKDFPPPTRTTNHNNPSRWLMTKISLPLSLITALECAKVRHWWCRFRNDFFCVIRKSWAFVAGRQSASCRHSDFGGSGNRTPCWRGPASPKSRLSPCCVVAVLRVDTTNFRHFSTFRSSLNSASLSPPLTMTQLDSPEMMLLVPSFLPSLDVPVSQVLWLEWSNVMPMSVTRLKPSEVCSP